MSLLQTLDLMDQCSSLNDKLRGITLALRGRGYDRCAVTLKDDGGVENVILRWVCEDRCPRQPIFGSSMA